MSFDRALWRLALLAPLMAGEANAAIIRGVVMENQTGHPLARTLVTVQPVAGTNGATASLRTNMYGAFESPPLPGGAYLVSASRPGFVTSYYGQKRWNSAGVPFPGSTTCGECEGRLVVQSGRHETAAGRVYEFTP